MKKLLLALVCGLPLFAADLQITSYENVKKMMNNTTKYSVVILGMDHCPFCKISLDAVKKIDPKYDEKAQFFYIDLDSNKQAKIDFDIQATPDILFFSPGGTLIEKRIGGLNEIGFAKRLNSYESK